MTLYALLNVFLMFRGIYYRLSFSYKVEYWFHPYRLVVGSVHT